MFAMYTAVLLLCGNLIGKFWRRQQHGTAIVMFLFIVGFAYLVKRAIHH